MRCGTAKCRHYQNDAAHLTTDDRVKAGREVDAAVVEELAKAMLSYLHSLLYIPRKHF
jgi:hypothetical protein